MPSFTETIIVVFTLIALGYGAAVIKLVKQSTGEGLADFGRYGTGQNSQTLTPQSSPTSGHMDSNPAS